MFILNNPSMYLRFVYPRRNININIYAETKYTPLVPLLGHVTT